MQSEEKEVQGQKLMEGNEICYLNPNSENERTIERGETQPEESVERVSKPSVMSIESLLNPYPSEATTNIGEPSKSKHQMKDNQNCGSSSLNNEVTEKMNNECSLNLGNEVTMTEDVHGMDLSNTPNEERDGSSVITNRRVPEMELDGNIIPSIEPTPTQNVASVPGEKLRCPHCPRMISRSNIAKHVSVHNKNSLNGIIHCTWCSVTVNSKEEYLSHLEQDHRRCPYCKRCMVINGVDSLDSHKVYCSKREN